MRIKLLDIKGFGRFTNTRIEPHEGVNVIYGRNEAGKTTLMAFIKAMLYGLKGGRKRDNRYQPWQGEVYAGMMEYALSDGQTFRIGRNFQKNTVQVLDGSANNITSQFPLDREQGPRFAETHLGIPGSLFEKTAFIGQMQSAVQEEGKKLVLERISNLSAWGGEELSLSKALAALEAARMAHVGTERSSTRPLDRVTHRIAQLEKQKAETVEQMDKCLDAWRLLRENQERLKFLKDELEVLRESRDKQLDARLSRLSDEYCELEKQLKTNEDKKELMQIRMEELERYGRLEDAPEEMGRLMAELSDLQKALKGLNTRSDELHLQMLDCGQLMEERQDFKARMTAIEQELSGKSERSQAQSTSRNLLIASLLSLGLSALALTGWLLTPSGILNMAFIAASPVFLVLSLVLLLLKARHRSNTMSRELKAIRKQGFTSLEQYLARKQDYLALAYTLESSQKELEVSDLKKKDYLKRKNEIVEILGSKLQKPGLSEEQLDREVESFKASLQEYRSLVSQLAVMDQGLKGLQDRMASFLREASVLTGGRIKTVEDLKSKYQTASSGAYPGQAGDMDVHTKMEELTLQIRDAEINVKEYETRLENAPSEGLLAEIEEELSRLYERKQQLEDLGISLTEAMDGLRVVARNLQKDYTPELNREMSRMARAITRDRYGDIRIDDAMGLMLEAPGYEALVPLEQLSGGTIDQVYLAMRLAAVGLMERGGEKLPLFMDEPFAQYDDDRVTSAFQLLSDISTQRQIFLFTCKEREVTLAREVFGDRLNIIRL